MGLAFLKDYCGLEDMVHFSVSLFIHFFKCQFHN